MDQHHKYSASGSEGWMTCAGKLVMEEGIKEEYSPYADEGSAAHFLAATCLLQNKKVKDFLGREIICWTKEGERDGQCFSDEVLPENATERSRWQVTRDMVEHIQFYCDTVRKMAVGGTLLVEQRVVFGDAIGLPGAFGTSDVIIVSSDGSKLTICDLKYGHNEVSAIENTQMQLYALGALAGLDVEEEEELC